MREIHTAESFSPLTATRFVYSIVLMADVAHLYTHQSFPRNRSVAEFSSWPGLLDLARGAAASSVQVAARSLSKLGLLCDHPGSCGAQ